MFLPCRPCCGGSAVAPVDACLNSCRPPGETGTLSEINVTLSAYDYTVSVEVLETSSFPSYTRSYTMNYKFIGSSYSGTYSLTPSAYDSEIFEYLFPSCAGFTPSIKYYLKSLGCGLVVDLPALIEPEAAPPVNGEDTTPTCAASQAVQLYTERKVITSCGSYSLLVLDAKTSPVYIDPGTGGRVLLPTNDLYAQIVGTQAMSFGQISLFKHGTDRDSSYFNSSSYPVKGSFNVSTLQKTTDASTATESGDPLVTLTSMTTTYA